MIMIQKLTLKEICIVGLGGREFEKMMKGKVSSERASDREERSFLSPLLSLSLALSCTHFLSHILASKGNVPPPYRPQSNLT